MPGEALAVVVDHPGLQRDARAAVSRRRNMRDCWGKSARRGGADLPVARRARVMRLLCELPAIAGDDAAGGGRGAQRLLGQRVVGEDDDPAVGGVSSCCLQPLELLRVDAGRRRAVAVDGVDQDRADVGAEVDRVVHAGGRARRSASPGALSRARVGGDVDACRARTGRRAARRRPAGRRPRRAAARSSGSRLGTSRSPVGERVDRRRGRDLALREHVVVADQRVPRRLQALRP